MVAVKVRKPQAVQRPDAVLGRRLFVPLNGFRVVLLHALPLHHHGGHLRLAGDVALLRGAAVPLVRLPVVPGQAVGAPVQQLRHGQHGRHVALFGAQPLVLDAFVVVAALRFLHRLHGVGRQAVHFVVRLVAGLVEVVAGRFGRQLEQPPAQLLVDGQRRAVRVPGAQHVPRFAVAPGGCNVQQTQRQALVGVGWKPRRASRRGNVTSSGSGSGSGCRQRRAVIGADVGAHHLCPQPQSRHVTVRRGGVQQPPGAGQIPGKLRPAGVQVCGRRQPVRTVGTPRLRQVLRQHPCGDGVHGVGVGRDVEELGKRRGGRRDG